MVVADDCMLTGLGPGEHCWHYETVVRMTMHDDDSVEVTIPDDRVLKACCECTAASLEDVEF